MKQTNVCIIHADGVALQLVHGVSPPYNDLSFNEATINGDIGIDRLFKFRK